jgi:hypothetical protein
MLLTDIQGLCPESLQPLLGGKETGQGTTAAAGLKKIA